MIDLDIAFDRIGGYGRFQKMMTLLLAVWKNSGQWCYYCFAYLVLNQTYLCRYEENVVLQFEDSLTNFFYSPTFKAPQID